MIEVIVEPNKGHILYQNGERLNYLCSTTVSQNAEDHYMTLNCEVEAFIWCYDFGINELKPCTIDGYKLLLPSGCIVQYKEIDFLPPEDEDGHWQARFICDAKLKP